ncbi:MAG: hypothetical protein MJY99_00880 [Fibrobacter sp.]|uniref:hypothetical protein n=1 Tax=Fibrobacter sp. TaxID=35828 RepID=UPI003890CED9|nr:hypothetical protein [Fibrobacter sp.]
MQFGVAEIALMFVLPLGITLLTILQTATTRERMHSLVGALSSFAIIVMDGLFYFAQNQFISYNADGGLLLAFASLIFFGLLPVVRSEDLTSKIANILFCFLAFTAFIGIAYWERPTFLVTAEYTPAKVALMNAKYQDYIKSFENGEGGKWTTAPAAKPSAKAEKSHSENAPSESSKARLDRYIDETNKVKERMQGVIESVNSFELMPSNISESDREQRGSQALALNNNATAINKKALGLFHPHESSEAHSELIKATESLRLAAYSLYTYTLQESAEEQEKQYKQSRDQIAQTKVYLERFEIDIQNLISNYQPQQTQEEN